MLTDTTRTPRVHPEKFLFKPTPVTVVGHCATAYLANGSVECQPPPHIEGQPKGIDNKEERECPHTCRGRSSHNRTSICPDDVAEPVQPDSCYGSQVKCVLLPDLEANKRVMIDK